MFAERFDALMSIAEVSNSMLAREIHMNPSHLGRLRSGARPLPKKHEYLPTICQYLVKHIKKNYQQDAIQNLTGIGIATLTSPEAAARYLEQWLQEEESNSPTAAGRLISGFSHAASFDKSFAPDQAEKQPLKYASHLYGNAGKRKAVAQFFQMILEENEPQTLLLFSDENMTWLYEDSAFALRWGQMFSEVLSKGNRVRIVHTTSRSTNDMLEAVTKWIPIYMTGQIDPYYYPRLRDGLFQQTIFIAPRTAAIISSSVQQDTDAMLNIFLTDKAALSALTLEYERLFALCRPLMSVYTERNATEFLVAAESLVQTEGDAYLLCTEEQYARHNTILRRLGIQRESLDLVIAHEPADSPIVFVKENAGVIMASESEPRTAFVIFERNIISSFWDYLERYATARK